MYKVSFYKNIFDTSSKEVVLVDDFLSDIKEGVYKKEITALRNVTQTERIKLKENLPNIATSGIFETRKDAAIITHSGLAQIDFDAKDNSSFTQTQIKGILINDKFTFAAFISPSGTGVKIIVKIAPDKHKEVYTWLQKYYIKEYKLKLDASCGNISKPMFTSLDTDLFRNYNSIEPQYTMQQEHSELMPFAKEAKASFFVPNNKNIHHAKTAAECWEFTEQKLSYLNGNRNLFLVTYGGNCNRAGLNKTDAINFALDNATDLSDTEIKKTINSAYNNIAEHGKYAFKELTVKNTSISTNNKPQIKPTEALKLIEGLFKRYNDSNGELKSIYINHTVLLTIMASFGFRRFDLNTSEYIFIQIKNNILKQVSQVFIQDTVFELFDNLPDMLQYDVPKEFFIEKVRRGLETFFSKRFCSQLKNDKDYIFCTDTKEAAFIFYKNVVVKCTKNGIELLDYQHLSGYIWDKQILDRTFKAIQPNTKASNVFAKFVANVCNSDENRINAIKSMIGYLLHNFFETKLKAIAFTDSTISNEPNGRTGKTLLGKAIQQIKPCSEINGKAFDPNERFKYQDVTFETQVIILNDLRRNFDVENLFNDISENVQVECKNKAPFKLRAKFLISTNQTLKIENASSRDRFMEFEFSEYYNEKKSPFIEFGKMFFGSDFTALDWLEFDNYMVDCVVYYLQNGLKEAETINLHKRKLLQQTNLEFINWLDSLIDEGEILNNKEYEKKELHINFLNNYPEYRDNKYLKQQRNFTNYLILYSKHSDKLEPLNDDDMRRSHGQDFIKFRLKKAKEI